MHSHPPSFGVSEKRGCRGEVGLFAAEVKERLCNFITHVSLAHLDGVSGGEVIGFGVHLLAESGRCLRQ